jgi:hypothetical protein
LKRHAPAKPAAGSRSSPLKSKRWQQRTAEATKEISTQISGIQLATNESASALQEIGGTINRLARSRWLLPARSASRTRRRRKFPERKAGGQRHLPGRLQHSRRQ